MIPRQDRHSGTGGLFICTKTKSPTEVEDFVGAGDGNRTRIVWLETRNNSRYTTPAWSGWRVSNPRPHGPKPCALPTELQPDIVPRWVHLALYRPAGWSGLWAMCEQIVSGTFDPVNTKARSSDPAYLFLY